MLKNMLSQIGSFHKVGMKIKTYLKPLPGKHGAGWHGKLKQPDNSQPLSSLLQLIGVLKTHPADHEKTNDLSRCFHINHLESCKRDILMIQYVDILGRHGLGTLPLISLQTLDVNMVTCYCREHFDTDM